MSKLKLSKRNILIIILGIIVLFGAIIVSKIEPNIENEEDQELTFEGLDDASYASYIESYDYGTITVNGLEINKYIYYIDQIKLKCLENGIYWPELMAIILYKTDNFTSKSFVDYYNIDGEMNNGGYIMFGHFDYALDAFVEKMKPILYEYGTKIETIGLKYYKNDPNFATQVRKIMEELNANSRFLFKK